jgi:hypothetical protein
MTKNTLMTTGEIHTPSGPVSAEEAGEIAVEAYIYAYPIILCELTRRASVGTGIVANQFSHMREFPDPGFTLVVRPNADTLYSQLWFDVSREPLAITVPDSSGRYYLLPMLDLWTDVFDSIGSRTTGTGAQLIVLARDGWQGKLPQGALLIHSPTSMGWLIGRTQTNGPADYPNVHRFQDGMNAAPLSRPGQPPPEPKGEAPGDRSSYDTKTPPVEQIEKLTVDAYFRLLTDLMLTNPPHVDDYPILHRMARIGIRPGESFVFSALSPEVKAAIDRAPAAALPQIKAGINSLGVVMNGWRVALSFIGAYGTAYRTRAAVAFGGLGANLPEDAVYPSAFVDGEGQPFSSDRRYVLHFKKTELPPVRGFWSLTLYDERQLFAPNPKNRYTIGDRDSLTLNPDGSLDLYIQRESPGPSRESNWLPAPARGSFTLNLRLYWPRSEVLTGIWAPPPIKKVP